MMSRDNEMEEMTMKTETMVGKVVWYAGERWRVYALEEVSAGVLMARCYAILNPDRFMAIPVR